MRRFSLVIVFVLLQSTIYSQTEDAFELCYAIQQNFNQFTSNSEANDALNRILYVTGATPNFVLMECDKINNAVAVTYKGQRYILYDKEFLSLISINTTSWSNTFILAHEVGHHINGHTKDIALGNLMTRQELEEQRKEELEADYYAGFVLSKLGANLSQTTAAINLIGSQGDDRYSTHPDRNKRIDAITRGWNNGVERNANTQSKSTKVKKTIAPSAWNKFIPSKDDPFNKDRAYAYTIGRVLPTTSKFSGLKPKLIISRDPGFENSEVFDIKINGLDFKTNNYIEDIYVYYVQEFIDTRTYDPWVGIDIPESIQSSGLDSLEIILATGIDFQKIVEEKVKNDFASNNDYVNTIKWSGQLSRRGNGNELEFEAVFDNEEGFFRLRKSTFDTDFFIDANKQFNYYVTKPSTYTINLRGREFVNLIKEKNKLFIKITYANSSLYKQEDFEYQTSSGRRLKVSYNIHFKNDLGNIMEFIEEDRYIEFDLTGSAKAIND